MTVKTLSATLTVVDWNQKKGRVATALVKTDLSQALFELEQAWEKVNWQKLDPERAMKNVGGKNYDLDRLDELRQAKDSEDSALKVIQSKLLLVEQAAEDAHEKYLAHAVHIPSSSKRAVQTIAAEAKSLSDALDNIDDEWDDYRGVLVGKIANLRRILKTNVKKVEKGLAAVLKTPNKAVWTAELHDAIRGLGVQVSNQPDLKVKYLDRTNVYASAPFVTNMKYKTVQAEKTDVLKKYSLVIKLLGEIVQDI